MNGAAIDVHVGEQVTVGGGRIAASLEGLLAGLNRAVSGNRTPPTCLRLWAGFIRARDGHRCVECHSRDRVAAHHICRKSFLPGARLQTGNGITLCRACHRGIHAGFNGRASLALPMDMEGGEKIETMKRLYGALYRDACSRGIRRDDLYFLGDDVLARFKLFQGCDPSTEFPGSRLEQAYRIWRQPPRGVAGALASANGFAFPTSPIVSDLGFIVFED